MSTAKSTAAKTATSRTAALKAASKTTAAKAAPQASKPAKPAKAAKEAKPQKPVIDTSKRYKFLSGVDDSAFCQRVSDHLDAGYELYGSPTMVVKGSVVYVGQAIVRKPRKSGKGKKKK